MFILQAPWPLKKQKTFDTILASKVAP